MLSYLCVVFGAGTVGLVTGGLLASAKIADREQQYEGLATALHRFLGRYRPAIERGEPLAIAPEDLQALAEALDFWESFAIQS